MSASSAAVEIESVEHLPIDETLLWGGCLECPQAGGTSEVFAIDLSGWALGRRSAAMAIEFRHAGHLLWHTPINISRADVAEAFPQAGESGRCGFCTAVGTVVLPRDFELQVLVRSADETRIPLAVIRGRRRSIAVDYTPQCQPLLINTVARSGSTWVMRVLGEHPQIVAYRPFRHEPLMECYWLEILKALTEPASFSQALQALPASGNWWIGADRFLPGSFTQLDPELRQWLAGGNLAALTTFCLERIDAFYRVAVEAQRQDGVVYFAEKCLPSHFAPGILHELYPKAKEIVLVRDFRDMICSLRAFSAKHGIVLQQGDDDQRYVWLRRNNALQMLAAWRDRFAHLLRYEDLIREPRRTIRSRVVKQLVRIRQRSCEPVFEKTWRPRDDE